MREAIKTEKFNIPKLDFLIYLSAWQEAVVNNVDYLRSCLTNETESPQFMLTSTKTRRLQVYFSAKYNKWYLAICSYKKGEEKFQITYTILMEEPSAEAFLNYAADLAESCIKLKEYDFKTPSGPPPKVLKRSHSENVGKDIPPPTKFIPPSFWFSAMGELDDGKPLTLENGQLPQHMQIDPVKERKEKGCPVIFSWSSNDNKVSPRFWFASDCKTDAYKHAIRREWDERVNSKGFPICYEIVGRQSNLEGVRKDASVLVEQVAMYVAYRSLVRQHTCDPNNCDNFHGPHPEGRMTMWILSKEMLLTNLLASVMSIWKSQEFRDEILFVLGAANNFLSAFTTEELTQYVDGFLGQNMENFIKDLNYYLSDDPEKRAFTHNLRRAVEMVRPLYRVKRENATRLAGYVRVTGEKKESQVPKVVVDENKQPVGNADKTWTAEVKDLGLGCLGLTGPKVFGKSGGDSSSSDFSVEKTEKLTSLIPN